MILAILNGLAAAIFLWATWALNKHSGDSTDNLVGLVFAALCIANTIALI